ncbi:MAG: pentapeptide repeat-containing protein [Hyphomicrobiales bacterium]|nr:pentapeptide repeat-containing protein [Hyphomicrobiales bacterium]
MSMLSLKRNGRLKNWGNSVKRFASETNLVVSVFMLVFCILLMLVSYHLLPVKHWKENLWIEFGGLTFDILFILVIFSLFEHRRQKRQDIARQKEIIEDYKRWDSEEARFRLSGAIRRLNRMGVFEINFSGCRLSHFSFSEHGIKDIHGSLFYNGRWAAPALQSTVELQNVDFTNLNCTDVVFSPHSGLTVNQQVSLRGAKFIDCLFMASKLNGAKFNGASLKWTAIPPDTLVENITDDNGEFAGTLQIEIPPFYDVDMSGVSFKNVEFDNVDFRDVKNILDADFSGATGLENAVFDDENMKTEVMEMARKTNA